MKKEEGEVWKTGKWKSDSEISRTKWVLQDVNGKIFNLKNKEGRSRFLYSFFAQKCVIEEFHMQNLLAHWLISTEYYTPFKYLSSLQQIDNKKLEYLVRMKTLLRKQNVIFFIFISKTYTLNRNSWSLILGVDGVVIAMNFSSLCYQNWNSTIQQEKIGNENEKV